MTLMERRKKRIKKRVTKFIKWGFIGLLVLGWCSVIAWAQLREVPSTQDPQTIVFETGTDSIVQFIVMMLLGLLMLLVGGFLSWAVTAEFVTERQDRLKNFGLALLFLVIFAMGAGILYYEIWEDARSERVVIDKTSETIKIEQSYFIRADTELRVAFVDILHIEYYYDRGSHATTPSIAPSGTVKVTKYDGTTIRISGDGPEPQYNLAKSIAEATRKPLIEKK